MAKDKTALQITISEQEDKLKQQLEMVEGMRGAREDVVRMIAPVFLDQLRLMREIVEAM